MIMFFDYLLRLAAAGVTDFANFWQTDSKKVSCFVWLRTYSVSEILVVPEQSTVEIDILILTFYFYFLFQAGCYAFLHIARTFFFGILLGYVFPGCLTRLCHEAILRFENAVGILG